MAVRAVARDTGQTGQTLESSTTSPSTAPSTARRWTLIAGLYVSQAIPLGFLILALPAILRRRGLGLELTGLLGALALPWLIKFAWAPLVDRFGSGRFGHYRSWIVPLQVVTVLTVAATSQIELGGSFVALFVAGGLFMFASATQDIATDGLAVRIVPVEERGRANGLQVGGYYLGQILGGGLVLVLYDRLGWGPALLAMAALLAMPLIPLFGFREPPAPAREAGSAKVDFAALKRFAMRPGSRAWISILLIYRAAEATAATMFNPMLVDGGLSLESIAITLGVAGSSGSLAGALIGGWLIERIGRKVALVVFGAVQAVALLAYLWPAAGHLDAASVYVAAAIVAAGGGMATAALYTNMMDRCDPRTGATDFTIQQSLCAIGPLVGASLSGVLAAAVGYSAHFALTALLGLVIAAWVAWRFTPSLATPKAPEAVVQSAPEFS